MRSLFGIVVLFVVSSGWVLGQSIPQYLRLADEHFDSNRFLEAIPYYEKVYGIDKRNYYAGFRMASCYERTLQYEEAEKEFKKLSDIPGHEYQTRAIYKYATLMKLESNFILADSIYQQLVKMPTIAPDLLELANRQREGCLLAMREGQKSRNAEIVELEHLNGHFHDFGAVRNSATGAIVFATTRNLPGEQYKGSQYVGMLPDLVAFEQRANGHWRDISNRNGFDKLNTHWSEGSGSFTKDGSTFYFSSCRGEGGTDCLIMVSYLVDEKWTDPTALNEYINEADSENKQPSISFTGDTLFFSSNRPGGLGGSDIWMSLKGDSLESWTPAINMGDVINTSENEISPYYSSANGSLLFASNGHVGYGGYDIYGAKGNAFFKPDLFNIGRPFNSTWDDTYFSISDTTGFLSSNRKNKEVLNNYTFNVQNEDLFLSLLYAGEMLIDGQVVSKFRNAGSIDLVTFRAEDFEGYALFQPIKSEKKDIRKFFGDKNADAQKIPGARYRTGRSFEQLYFDYGLATLRTEAKKALDDFYSVIKDQPYTMVNLLAFTDHHGHEHGNNRLSHRRGVAVREYLIAKGIPEKKVRVLPRGELNPEEGFDHWFTRVFSRRVELHIDASEPLRLPVAKGVILRKPMTLDLVAKRLNLSSRDVSSWNGNHQGELGTGSTIRLYLPDGYKLDSDYFITQENIAVIFQ
jgi:peptidoglycan-associated lipoprotein